MNKVFRFQINYIDLKNDEVEIEYEHGHPFYAEFRWCSQRLKFSQFIKLFNYINFNKKAFAEAIPNE